MIVDAGGLPVAGGRRLREGVAFRLAGGLARHADLDRLDRAGIRTVVDLRGAVEDRSLLARWAERTGARYVWLPTQVAGVADLVAAVRGAADAAAAAVHMRALYEQVVSEYGSELAGAIAALAVPGPVAFGCAAGKDRTGLVAALLQSVLGVADDDVIAAYVGSAPQQERLRRLMRDSYGLEDTDLDRPGLGVLLGAEAATLAWVRERFGGVESYLAAHGAGPEVVAVLRAKLVVPDNTHGHCV